MVKNVLAMKDGTRNAQPVLFLKRDNFAPLIRPADRTDPVGLLGAMTLRAGVDTRARQAVVGATLVTPRF